MVFGMGIESLLTSYTEGPDTLTPDVHIRQIKKASSNLLAVRHHPLHRHIQRRIAKLSLPYLNLNIVSNIKCLAVAVVPPIEPESTS